MYSTIVCDRNLTILCIDTEIHISVAYQISGIIRKYLCISTYVNIYVSF